MDLEPTKIERVQRIIALKRYEQPPPGYFHLLPERIMGRIEYGEGQSSFWEKWLATFTIRPALAYAFGLTVCGAVTVGMLCSAKFEAALAGSEPQPGTVWAVASPRSILASDTADSSLLRAPNWLGSTNPVTAPRSAASLFETTEARSIPVSFYIGN